MKKNDIHKMISDVRSEISFTREMTGLDNFNEKIFTAMSKVPRDAFVPEYLKAYAFADGPLPIGHGQTISQPYIVALMTELLDLQPEHTVLEIGTGSGYQTAILSQLCAKIYTMELIPELSSAAMNRFRKLHYTNIDACTGNGYLGWPEHAPYDGIIVTAAAPYVPETLSQQLKPGGKMVIPVGQAGMHQELMLVEKKPDLQTNIRSILSVAFVPLIDRPVNTEPPNAPGEDH